jgi:hypothetical protein
LPPDILQACDLNYEAHGFLHVKVGGEVIVIEVELY